MTEVTLTLGCLLGSNGCSFCTAWLVLALLPAGRQSVTYLGTLTAVWRELPVSFRFCTKVALIKDSIQLDAGSSMLT